jgi:hypothetical protein
MQPAVEPAKRDMGLKSARKMQKKANLLFLMSKFSAVSCQIFASVGESKWFNLVTPHTRCQFERNSTVTTADTIMSYLKK